MSDLEIPLTFPLDSDGFLRRACPTCAREFKWLPAEQDPQTLASEQYFCPYCGEGAPTDHWFTTEQSAYIRDEVVARALGPALDDLADSFRQINRSSGGLVRFSGYLERPERTQAPPVFEPDDMRRVTLECHPSEPLKIDEVWSAPVHCLVCGSSTNGTAAQG